MKYVKRLWFLLVIAPLVLVVLPFVLGPYLCFGFCRDTVAGHLDNSDWFAGFFQ